MQKLNASHITEQLEVLADHRYAQSLQRFFKTGSGEYAERDIFIGVRVPQLRKLARQHRELADSEIIPLLQSPLHESRFLALLLLIGRIDQADSKQARRIYKLYIKHLQYVNNWDLVDISAPHIPGRYLFDKERAPLRKLARSKVLWHRRIAVVFSLYFIKRGDFDFTLRIARDYLGDSEDLIHKATGWMLREIANRDREVIEKFLHRYYTTMPRTMLRYTIEKFPSVLRSRYLRGEI